MDPSDSLTQSLATTLGVSMPEDESKAGFHDAVLHIKLDNDNVQEKRFTRESYTIVRALEG